MDWDRLEGWGGGAGCSWGRKPFLMPPNAAWHWLGPPRSFKLVTAMAQGHQLAG